MRGTAILAAAWCVASLGTAQAQGIHALVDRLSARVDGALGGDADAEKLRPLEGATPDEARSTVHAAAFVKETEGPNETAVLALSVKMPGAGPRLLLVDAGLVFRGPAGADYVALPNQRFVLEQPETKIEVEALPLWPDKPSPPAGTALRVVRSNDPGLIAVLRTAHRLESEDAQRATRYVRERDGQLQVETFLENEDVRLARWMSWSKDAAGQIRGRLPRDGVRFAIFAVTAGFTIQDTADWLRLKRSMDMNPAIAAAWELAKQTEYILERAGLNFRVFSPNHALFHFNQGVAAFRRSELDVAEKSFRKAMDLDASFIGARHDLGVVLYRAGRYDEAAEAFLMATGMEGAGADSHYNRGATLYRLGDKLGAARAFRRAAELNPRDTDVAAWIEKADPEGRTKAAPEKPRKGKGVKK